MSKFAVSVIIPTYKSESFIHNVLDSLVRQSIDHDRFEVIIIDDCSPDNTKKVVASYRGRIKHLIYLKTEHNTGNPITGRNLGIRKARGEYIHFIDHDDYISNEALERFYNSAVNWNSDVISGKNVAINNGPMPVRAFKYGEVVAANPFDHPAIVTHLAPIVCTVGNFY